MEYDGGDMSWNMMVVICQEDEGLSSWKVSRLEASRLES